MIPQNRPYITLKQYFTTGTAESEEAIVDEAYVPTEGLLEIINPPPASPRVLVGKKGSGKSIVLKYFRNRFQEAGIPVLILRPSDLDPSKFPAENNLGVLIRYFKDEIVSAVGIHIGRELKGFLTSEEEITLSKLAKSAKARSGDWYENILDFIVPLGAGLANVDYTKLAQSVGDASPKAVEESIKRSLGKNKKLFYFMFDDTDQVADPGQPHHLNRIWAFLLALRQIMEKCQNIRCIITLRSEVWVRLGRDDTTQRDQVDHIRELIYELNPSEVEVRDIASRRFILATPKETKLNHGNETKPFFEGDVTLSAFDEKRTWYDFIIKRSRERPRDMIQLVSALIKAAESDRSRPPLIKSIHAEQIVVKFSKERIEDLRREVESECPNIEKIIRTFSSIEYDLGGFSCSAGVLKDHLMRVPSVCTVIIFGEKIQQMTETSAFKLWRYLFDIGFLGARFADSHQPKGFDHKSVRDDSTLVDKSRWTELEKIHWDINPAYRDALHDIRKTEYLGLANRGARKRPRLHES